ncbi:hypothetical protein BJX63DRAFT_429791 [Aspergillus granulosus]|uniref:Uncharacterized protein n=1 Tax=Aspergillus granulosus TaxID=176169 RepID=A0ABR4HPI7_9EURO
MHFLSLLTSTLLLTLSSLGAVAAQGFGKPHGIDSGNTACTGACVDDPELLDCSRIQYRPQYDCYMCCISDDDLDRMDEGFGPLDEEDGYRRGYDQDDDDDDDDDDDQDDDY